MKSDPEQFVVKFTVSSTFLSLHIYLLDSSTYEAPYVAHRFLRK
jgi:hypothetical protein